MRPLHAICLQISWRYLGGHGRTQQIGHRLATALRDSPLDSITSPAAAFCSRSGVVSLSLLKNINPFQKILKPCRHSHTEPMFIALESRHLVRDRQHSFTLVVGHCGSHQKGVRLLSNTAKCPHTRGERLANPCLSLRCLLHPTIYHGSCRWLRLGCCSGVL